VQADAVGKIVADYGAVLGEPTGLGVVRDLRSLQHSKDDIKAALMIALGVTEDATMREHLKAAYVSLADFQELTDEETRALHLWNSAMSSSTTTAKAISLISSGADVVIAVQERVVRESNTLKKDLEAAGF